MEKVKQSNLKMNNEWTEIDAVDIVNIDIERVDIHLPLFCSMSSYAYSFCNIYYQYDTWSTHQ